MINDFFLILYWWVWLLGIGVVCLPLSFLLFRRFFDLGWGFSKILGIALLSYLVFLFGILKILPFNQLTLFFFLGVLIALNGWVLAKNWGEIQQRFWQKRKIIAFEETLFLLGLLVWSYIRGNNPEIVGLEKFMDFGFINSVLRSTSFPPLDIWMAGETINYYWFGHLTVALLTKLSGIPSEITYNLMVGTIFALVFVATFALSSTLIRTFFQIKGAMLGGIISATLLTLGGNWHTIAWHLFPQLKTCQSFYSKTSFAYWYPDATRFIGYCPQTLDKTIHEFPSYSFVVSDLHAHFLNLPFVILFLALLFRLLRGREKTARAFLYGVIPPAFILGIMFMTNIWDFAAYLMVSGIGLLMFVQMGSINRGFFWEIFKKFAGLTVTGLIFALPFILNFSSLSSGLGLVHSRTPLWQLLILWGAPLSLTILSILIIFRKNTLVATDRFLAALLVSSWVLILLPEIFYVKDIYIPEYYRANTMFKFTYQAFVMFSLAAGYIMLRIINLVRGSVRFVCTLGFVLFAFSLLIYPYFAIRGYYGDLKEFQGLSGAKWLEERYLENWQAIAWLRKNVVGQPTILEAPGDSYTDYNQISAYTGLPTVEGWLVHEWLWRGSFDEPGGRASDVEKIYTSGDIKTTRGLLEKYSVSYVFIGKLEREKYPTLNETQFEILGEKVFSAGTTAIFRVPNYNASSWLY